MKSITTTYDGHRLAIQKSNVDIIVGITSQLASGYHIPMVDVDDRVESMVRAETLRIMKKWKIKAASIYNTGKTNGWHVYFWYPAHWIECMHIMIDFEYEDPWHLTHSIQRGYVTLRKNTKSSRKITHKADIGDKWVMKTMKEQQTETVLYEITSPTTKDITKEDIQALTKEWRKR